MAFYEHVFIARQDVSPAQAEALVEEFKGVVEAHGGKVLKQEYWGLRNLAYMIEKNRKGHYALLGLDGDVEMVNELERRQRIHEDVIRYMTVRVDEIEEQPSAILRSRDDKRKPGGGRGRRD